MYKISKNMLEGQIDDGYKYRFSVIIPVYNVEEYLEETILTVVEQTIGFEENIQLILINDGSTDNSDKVCLKFKELYPDNVVYVEKENGGVSSARNEGIKYIEGKYTNFLDSDDKWERNAFIKVYNRFESIADEVDVLSCRIQRFDAKNTFHVTDFKYRNGNSIVDLTTPEDECAVQLSASNVFIKSEVVKKNRFSENIKYGEDSMFINKIILEKMKYGIMSNVIYFYRVRQNTTSAVQTQAYDKSFYFDTVREYHIGLAEYCRERYGEVYPYVQAVIAYDLGWRLFNDSYKEVLTPEEQTEYLDSLKKAYSNIEDRIIIKHPVHKLIYRKMSAFKIKYGCDPYQFVKYIKTDDPATTGLFFRDTKLYRVFSNYIHRFEIVNGKIIVEGLVIKWLFDVEHLDVSLKFKYGSMWYTPEIKDYPLRKVPSEDGPQIHQKMYHLEIPVGLKKVNQKRLRAYLFFGEEKKLMTLYYGKFISGTRYFEKSYMFFGNICVIPDNKHLMISRPPERMKERKRLELEALKWLKENNHKDVARIREKYWLHKLLSKNKKQIWLISDRLDNAGDNGEIFFKYVCSLNLTDVRPIFLIGKNAPKNVIKRLKSYGEVLFAEDKKFPVYFLLADKIISSGASEFTINPFGKKRCFLLDLMRFKYYYLQHGVACADLSSWLNRFNKNIDMFFTSSEKERNSIINGNYLYDESQIKLTGMSRFDELKNNPEKQILILPTWRRSIRKSYDVNTRSVYYDGFKDTEYFKFYNSLINNERLLAVMREKGYKGLFCLHPIHMKQWVDFDGNDVFTVNEGFIDYNDVFEKSSLMVTDYSSVLFDFTYLRKPVVYSQFDKEDFFKNQIYDEGYFSYEKDGFGPVCYDFEKTVDEIINLIQNDCELEPKYRGRIDNFYAFNDSNNCERIYKAIIEDDK